VAYQNIIKKDEAILEKEQDKLNYNGLYVPILYDLLEKESNSLKIGVFGKYGSGKSSLLKLVKNELNSRKSEVIEISVWGHNLIGIIRRILIKLSSRLVSKNQNNKNKICLYNDTTKYINFKHKQNQFIFSIIFISMITIGFLLFLNYNSTDLITTLVNIFLITTPILVVIIGFSALNQKIESKPLEIDEFQTFLKNKIILKADHNRFKKQIILIIDDLDRCSYETVLETLDKLEVIYKEIEESNMKIKIIIPFSLSDFKDHHKLDNFNNLESQFKKLLDCYFWIPNLSKFELYKISKGEKD
jgi:GTPase SAR1 family protein